MLCRVYSIFPRGKKMVRTVEVECIFYCPQSYARNLWCCSFSCCGSVTATMSVPSAKASSAQCVTSGKEAVARSLSAGKSHAKYGSTGPKDSATILAAEGISSFWAGRRMNPVGCVLTTQLNPLPFIALNPSRSETENRLLLVYWTRHRQQQHQ